MTQPRQCTATHIQDDSEGTSGEVTCGRDHGHTGHHYAGPGITWPQRRLGEVHHLGLGGTSHGNELGCVYPDGSATVALTIGDRPAELHLDPAQRIALVGALLLPTEAAVPTEDTHVVQPLPSRSSPGSHRREGAHR